MATKLDIAVIGAGLAGLSTAIACAHEGHKVTVYESSKQLGETGAGIAITPNAVRILFRWGLEDAMLAQGVVPESFIVSRYADGKRLVFQEDVSNQLRAKFGAPYVDLHRADLHQLLVAKAAAAGATIRTAARVTDLDLDSAKPSLTLESGETVTADLIVGADGLWSRCREVLLQRADKPLPTGDLAYRIVLNLHDIADPDVRSLIQSKQKRFWIGPHMHCVGYAIRSCDMYNLVLLCPDNLPADVARQPGSREELQRLVADWDPLLHKLLDHVAAVDKWKLMHRPQLDAWTSPAAHFALVGDACHPMLPYLAQGAGSSIEDGAVLGALLRDVADVDEVPARVRAWEALRKRRGEAIIRESFVQRDQLHLPDGAAQRERDAVFEQFVGKEITADWFPNRLACPRVHEWLFGYDAFGEADAALAKMRQTSTADHDS